MNKDKIKVKHLISMYKDLPEYPTPEDLCYEVSKWYYQDGGRAHIKNHTSIDDISNPVFTIQNAEALTGLKASKLEPIIEKMLIDGILTVPKETQHNRYLRFETNDYL